MTQNTDHVLTQRVAPVLPAGLTRDHLPPIIGIAGCKRAGKDTLARLLLDTLPGYRLDSFAAPIRRFVAALVGLGTGAAALDALERHKEDPVPWLGNVTPRRMMQTLGTEWGRDLVHPDIWIMDLVRRAGAGALIVSDVRLPNEAQAIRDAGGVVFLVHRPGLPATDTHRSEAPLPEDLIDHVVVNATEPERMLDQVLEWLAATAPNA